MTPGPESDRVHLAYIQQCMERIREYTEGGQATFYDSSMVQDAVVRNLQNLAGSTRKLSDSLKEIEPDMPWSKIADFRDVLTREYLQIDLKAVWSVVEEDLPVLESAIERMARTIASNEDCT